MQTVINGLLTYYEAHGDMSKPCLLILHGWQRSSRDWKHVAETLSSSYYVILLDLPGFDGTAHPQATFGTYDYADFVTAFTKKLDIKTFSLIGHSFGGRVGIILGSKTTLLERLILVDSAGTEKLHPLYKLLLLALKPLFRILPKPIVKRLKMLISSNDYLKAGDMRDIFKKVIAEDLSHLLGNVHVPTLVIWGNEDKILPVSTTKLFKKKITDCRVRIVWGAGHHPHIEKEEMFIQIVTEFLNA